MRWLFVLICLSISWQADAYKYIHEVLPGERLSEIAKRYHTTVKKIIRINRINPRMLRSGTKLKIRTSVPSREIRKIRYTVKRGDSLSKIAKKHRMKTGVLKKLNHYFFRKKKILRPGDRIWVVIEGPKPKGSVRGLYQLKNGINYRVRDPRRSWGTLLAINHIHNVIEDFHARFPDAPKTIVKDISKKRGGYFPPHRSHRVGRDVDLPYPLKKKYYKKVSRARPRHLNVKRTWWVINRFLETKDVVFIFMDYPLQRVLYKYAQKKGVSKARLKKLFQYPRGKRAHYGIIRDEPGHATHYHVRFRNPNAKKKKRRAKKRKKALALKKKRKIKAKSKSKKSVSSKRRVVKRRAKKQS